MLYSPRPLAARSPDSLMTSSIRRLARLACVSLLVSLLAACGGCVSDEPAAAAAAAAAATTVANDSMPRAKFIKNSTVNAGQLRPDDGLRLS